MARLDALALAAWGLLLLKYWVTGQLAVLIHPNYNALVVVDGFGLLGLTAWYGRGRPGTMPQGVGSLLPRSWSRGLLLASAVVGLITTPQPFSSQTALAKGDLLNQMRTLPQQFKPVSRPENRSLVDWVRLLSAYPEPDAYQNQPARVQGFVIQPPDWPDGTFFLARYVITCCAADAYPVGLPVRLPPDAPQLKPDDWFQVEGSMGIEPLEGQRRVVLMAHQLQPIPRPANPYLY